MSTSAIITLNRVQSFSGMLRKFAVYIDGRKIDGISTGEGKTYQVTPGEHNLEVRLDFYKSPPMHLTIAAGSMISLICGDTGPSSLGETYTMQGLGKLANSLINPGNYLYVKPADTGQTKTSPQVSAPPASENKSRQDEIRVQSHLHANKTSIADKAKAGTQLFLSYRRSDSGDMIGRLCDRLFSHYGTKNVFRDIDSIPIGADFRTHIKKTIATCSAVVVIIGPDWLAATGQDGKRRIDDADDPVRVELELALEHELPLIPLLVKGAKMPSSELLPESIGEMSYRNAFILPADPFFHVGVDKLIEDIDFLGTPVKAAILKFCTNCGNDLMDGFRFCTGCGNEISPG